MIALLRRSTCLVFLLLCCRSTLGTNHLLRSNQKAEKAAVTTTKNGDQFIFTTLAIAGAAYGAYQAGDAIAHHVNAKEHAKQYKKGVKDAIRYALHKEEFDLTTNNMATMLIMNAWDNCLPLRGFITAIWKELLLKREVHKQKAEEQRNALKETLLDTKEVYDVEGMVQSSAEDACKMFDDEHSSSIANFFSDLSTEDLEDMNDSAVDTSSSEAVLLSLTITGVKLFAKGSEKFHEDSSLNVKRKSHEYSAWFSKLASYTGTGVSLIGAMFDPTGLSIMSLAGSIAGSAGAENMAKEERMGWKQHYCPALDDALLHNKKKLKEVTGMTKENHVEHHFGPIVNNVDCLERTTKALCLMPVEKECVKQKKTRLCRMKNMVSLSDEDEDDYDNLEELEECDHLKRYVGGACWWWSRWSRWSRWSWCANSFLICFYFFRFFFLVSFG